MKHNMVKIDDLKRPVLLYLCNHDKAPNKDIEKSLGVAGADITRVLRSLGSLITTLHSTDNKRPRSLVHDIPTLEELVIAFKHDPDSQREFIESQYYRDWISELVQRYADLIPSADALSAWFIEHLHVNVLNCHIQLSEHDRKVLTESLETSFFMLDHVSNFISLPNEHERIVMLTMISHLQWDINNSPISPMAAWKDGLLCGAEFFCERTNTSFENIKPAYDDLIDVLRHEPIINWEAYFKQVVQTNKYHQLIDRMTTYD